MDVVSRRSSWCFGEKDTDYVYGLYFEQLEKMLDYTYFDVICHIDLVKNSAENLRDPLIGRWMTYCQK